MLIRGGANRNASTSRHRDTAWGGGVWTVLLTMSLAPPLLELPFTKTEDSESESFDDGEDSNNPSVEMLVLETAGTMIFVLE